MRLLPHQEEARAWLVQHRRAYLADAPRTGKTYPTVLALSDIAPEGVVPVLVVCPASVVPVWEHAIAHLAPKIAASVRSFDKFRREAAEHAQIPYRAVVIDEAHRVKNPAAKITVTLLPLAAKAPYAWLLSGTPVPNHPGELYAPLRALWPEKLPPGGMKGWLDHTCHWTMGEYGPRVFGLKDAAMFKALLESLPMMRREMVPVLPIGAVPVPIAVSAADRDVLGEAETLLAEGAGPVEHGHPVMATARRIIGEAKVEPYIRFALEEGLVDSKRVIMAYHHTVLDALARGLEAASVPVWRVDGTTPSRERAERMEAFQRAPSGVFLGQIQACREGIDLSSADLMDIVEPAWTPGHNEQASMRIQNVNQLDTVSRKVVRFLYAPSTIDEAVLRVLARKSDVLEDLAL